MNDQKLEKSIGVKAAVLMVVGMVIGSGIFFKASTVFNASGNALFGISAWVIGGIIAIASALTISEIATAIPKTGGVFVYLQELYNEKLAFLFGWVQTFLYVPGSVAALSVVFITQATYFVEMTVLEQRLYAMALIVFLVIMNIISTKLGKNFQVLATIGKLIPLFIIIGLGITKGTAGAVTSLSIVKTTTGFAGFGTAILGTLWAYDGWIGITNLAGELQKPEKNLPKAIIGGLMVITGVYVLFNFALINILPFEAVANSATPATDAAKVLFGNSGAGFIAVGIMISILGAANGYLMAGVRIPYAMSDAGLFPFAKQIGKVTEKNHTPIGALILEGFLACILVLTGSFDLLTNMAMFMVWFFFIIAVAGIFVLRKRKIKSTYKVPFYPVVPLIGIIGGLYIIVSTLIADFTIALVGIVITLTGLPVYYIIKKKA